MEPGFRADWRREQSRAFDLLGNSTAREIVEFELWGRRRRFYANANLSIYSRQSCNARCPFCVERLRPLDRGVYLEAQKVIEADDRRYFERLKAALDALRPLNPSVSITGGEPSLDPTLLSTLKLVSEMGMRKRTITTNGSSLLELREGIPLIDHISSYGVAHLNLSRAHFDSRRNAQLMRLSTSLSRRQLKDLVARASAGRIRVRLSAVLVKGAIDDFSTVLEYLAFAKGIGVDNVVFRQLMLSDPTTTRPDEVTKYNDTHRIELGPLLHRADLSREFDFVRQVLGYYYYVEVWRYAGMDVVFESANLSQARRVRHRNPGAIHELVFHPNACLTSTWQPWDGILEPPAMDESGRIHRRLASGRCDALA